MQTVLRFFVFFLALTGMAYANEDEGLYAPAPPTGAAFVRFVDATGGNKALNLAVGEVKLEAPKGGAGAYGIVMQGEQEAVIGNSTAPLVVMAGHFYSVVASGSSSAPALNLLEDPRPANPAKAVLVFYNLTDHEILNLSTADGKTTVINAVAKGISGNRAVNPVNVGLAVSEGGKALAGVAPVQLERGQSYSIIATGTGDEVKAVLVKGATSG